MTDEVEDVIEEDVVEEQPDLPGMGHNAGPDLEPPAEPEVLGATAQSHLKSFIERVERLEEDKAAIGEDLKELFAEIKGSGFDTKIVRKVVRLRKQDTAKRQEEEALVDLYVAAIGGL